MLTGCSENVHHLLDENMNYGLIARKTVPASHVNRHEPKFLIEVALFATSEAHTDGVMLCSSDDSEGEAFVEPESPVKVRIHRLAIFVVMDLLSARQTFRCCGINTSW